MMHPPIHNTCYVPVSKPQQSGERATGFSTSDGGGGMQSGMERPVPDMDFGPSNVSAGIYGHHSITSFSGETDRSQ